MASYVVKVTYRSGKPPLYLSADEGHTTSSFLGAMIFNDKMIAAAVTGQLLIEGMKTKNEKLMEFLRADIVDWSDPI